MKRFSRLLILFISLLVSSVSGAAGVAEKSHCSNSIKQTAEKDIRFDENFNFYPASVKPARARLFLIHALFASKEQFSGDDVKGQFRKHLQESGIEVVTFSLPATKPEMFADGGTTYGRVYARFLPGLVNKVSTEHGPSPMTIIGGVSFGGLHALMGMILHPELFQAYFAQMPPILLEKTVYFPGATNVNFNPLDGVKVLATKPGFMTYATRDDQVDGELDKALVASIQFAGASKFSYIPYDLSEHWMTKEMADSIASWCIKNAQ